MFFAGFTLFWVAFGIGVLIALIYIAFKFIPVILWMIQEMFGVFGVWKEAFAKGWKEGAKKPNS